MIDDAEEWLVSHGRCAATDAQAFVTRSYIERAAGIVSGATLYLANDERIGADHFLYDLPGAATKLRSRRRMIDCALMLSQQPQLFFPMFFRMLQTMLYEQFAEYPNGGGIRINGVVLLAAASLPGGLHDIRRELRRRGETQRTLVLDRDIKQVTPFNGTFAIPRTKPRKTTSTRRRLNST